HFALHFVGIDDEPEYQTDGCDLLHALYRNYHDSTAIIEGLVRVINAVMQYDDIVVARMNRKKSIKSMLKEVATRFREHKVLVKAAQDSLRKMEVLAL
ncbi:hypothetical protein CSKR_100610, partial [Clonorchis sinensis]